MGDEDYANEIENPAVGDIVLRFADRRRERRRNNCKHYHDDDPRID